MAFVVPVVGWIASNAAAISATASVIGTGVSTYAAYEQGKAADRKAKYEAAVVRSNAMQQKFDANVNEQNAATMAQSALQEGAAERSRLLSKSKRALASFTAQQARFGLQTGSVSFTDSLKSIQGNQSLAVADIGYKTALQGRSLRQQGRNAVTGGIRALDLGASRSDLLIASGRNQRRAGTMRAIGTGLSGSIESADYISQIPGLS